MGKRGNENSQLSKEEYEALSASGSGGPSGAFSKASADQLSKRRIVRSRRPVPKAGGSTGLGGTPGKPAGGGIFSSIKLSSSAATNSTGGGGFGGLGAPKAPATTITPATSTTTMGGFGKPPAVVAGPAAPGPPAFALPSQKTLATATRVAALAGSSSRLSADQECLLKNFRSFVETAHVRTDFTRQCQQFLTTSMHLLRKAEPAAAPAVAEAPKHAAPGPAVAEAPKHAAPAPATNVPAAPAFSFGAATSTTSTGEEPKPTNNNLFSFGGSSSSSSPPKFSFGAASSTTAPAPSGSGFSFAPAAPGSQAVGSGIQVKLSPVPEKSGGGEGNDTTKDEGPTVLESADDDWKEEKVVKIRAYHYRSESKKPTRFADGNLKIQSSKSDAGVRRMVLRDLAGKVLINLGISKDMSFTKNLTQSKGAAKKQQGTIIFTGKMEGRDPEMFLFVCRPEDLESFHACLTQSP